MLITTIHAARALSVPVAIASADCYAADAIAPWDLFGTPLLASSVWPTIYTNIKRKHQVSKDLQVHLVGTLTADPELRFTSGGQAVANFTVVSNERRRDAQGNWVDGDATFLRCTIWRDAAENVAESLQKGQRVIVHGYLKQRSFETREGDKRTVIEVEVDEIGPSLRWATARVSKVGGNSNGGGSSSFKEADANKWGDDEPPF